MRDVETTLARHQDLARGTRHRIKQMDGQIRAQRREPVCCHQARSPRTNDRDRLLFLLHVPVSSSFDPSDL